MRFPVSPLIASGTVLLATSMTGCCKDRCGLGIQISDIIIIAINIFKDFSCTGTNKWKTRYLLI